MSAQKVTTIDFDEFQLVADSFIERSSQSYGEMPAATFFEILFEKMSDSQDISQDSCVNVCPCE